MLHALIHLIWLLNKFFSLKAEADKLVIAKLVKVPTGLNKFKAKADDSDVGKIKTIPVDFEKTWCCG